LRHSGRRRRLRRNLGREQLPFLRKFLPFANGIPSHDTLSEVVRAIDPELFKACFISWVETLRQSDPDLIAVDGKTSRRTHARSKGREPLHLVSAPATISPACGPAMARKIWPS
jgi:DDE_Tnp_1-associated